MKKNKSLRLSLFTVIALLLLASCSPANDSTIIEVTYDGTLSEGPFDGRLLVLISKDDSKEPRFQINDTNDSGIVVGKNVSQWQSGQIEIFNSSTEAYPIENLADLETGTYYIQALLHKYETFNLANGHQVKLPMDQGEGQHWNTSPKNIYSKPLKLNYQKGMPIKLNITEEIPPIEPVQDTEYIKHIKIKSELLSEFWGRPMYLQANVLVPEGFDKAAETRYPLMVFHGHFPKTIGGFRTTPPTAPKEDSIFNPRFGITGYKYIQEKEAYDFYRQWTSKDFPRFLVIEIQHQNPYYDDSYAVNSANLGPYGDAITYELIPHIEKLFNGVGAGWGRFLYGGSTGGWEALAVQVFYPKEYNGCFAACPDPIDFRAYTVVDIYKDKNAYYKEGEFKKTLRPGMRDGKGHIKTQLIDMNRREYILGDNSRSGDQWDIWQAVYSPVGENGYPKPIWDKLTGEIDHEVANYWKENYDLRYIMERDWDKIGKDLEGKVNIYCGDMDNYYLNNAVVLTEAFLEKTTDPYYGGEVDYGNGAEHCWNGDQENPNYISRLRYNTMYLNKIKERLKKTAPKKHRLKNWGI
ncbi:MAG: hypothetical protein EBY37_07625 [Flavobacteriia bacterium]|nr:hypothetical protein [Flavobacteriia bacterium]